MKNYEPADNGTFMHRVMDTIKRNPGMAAAGASMLGNMRGGDVAKFAVAAFVAYKAYSAYQNRQERRAAKTNEIKSDEPKKPGLGKTLKDKASAGLNKGKSLYTNLKDDIVTSSLESRMAKIAAYDDVHGRNIDPKLGFSRSQMDAAIESVAPISETPTMKAMLDAASTDKHGPGGAAYRAYLENVASNAEHKMAWEQHLDKAGVKDLSELKFCAVDSEGKLLKDSEGKTVMIDPYEQLKSMPHGDNATPQELYSYQAAKADIDKTLLYAMDHGQICGMKGSEDQGFARIDAPKDAYNRNLDAMDASNRKFAGIKSAIRHEQLESYCNASAEKKAMATPAALQAQGKTMDFQAVITAVNWFRAKAQGDRAAAAEKGADYERIQTGEMLRSARAVETDFEAKPATKQSENAAAKEAEPAKPRESERGRRAKYRPAEPVEESPLDIIERAKQTGQQIDDLNQSMLDNFNIEFV